MSDAGLREMVEEAANQYEEYLELVDLASDAADRDEAEEWVAGLQIDTVRHPVGLVIDR